ncbi:NADH dehydrogenase [ubiquinone] flavoprotein 3, mitochondrial [Fundulus diaphanus]
MAAWLRFGRLGSFKVDGCGTLIRHPVTWLCSEAKESGQAIKNLKGPHNKSAAAPPVTEEPFDNSTYKNYQHHSYTNYTFADLDVEMAKHRLPQPSSGKSSPRH